jgi:hypothetical protein
MRKSRLLLAGVAVAAAGVATSAFTASNTFEAGVQNTVAGYGEATVAGANITAIHYLRGTDPNVLATVVWDSDSDLSAVGASDASMTLKDGTTVLDTYDCTIAVGTPTTISCTVGDVNFEDFDTAGLAVGGA